MLRKTLMLSLLALSIVSFAQENVNYKKYPDYAPFVRPDNSLMMRKADAAQRPVRVNNAENIYFPSIFNQDGGSCGSASRISYMFNYEINAYRRLDSSIDENIYPSHFTWLLTNSGSSKDAMAIANGIPNIVTYGGRTYSALFGNQDCADNDFGWMQGYDKWYSAMFNRLERTANFPLSVETEEGREAVKNWLWNHNGDTSFGAGGVCGIGVASGGIWLNIPETEANNALGVTGQFYVGSWGKQVDHAMTIVGYDDRIEFDLDGNGVAGEVEKDEVGAWIVANSWGSTWCNGGFIYCPYKNAVTSVNGGYYMPEVYHIRKDYRPLRTIKIKMDYSKRSEILLSAGISADVNADFPEKTIQFEHFKYAGDGDNNGYDAETPMLGRWKDGLHTEPMEFGYDLTDLSANFDTRRPLKYFFIIETKKAATGSGILYNCSVLDYEFDKEGVEFPVNVGRGVAIRSQGTKTIVSVVVGGEPLNAPRNIAVVNDEMSWNAPVASTYELKGYNIYDGAEKMQFLDKEVTSCPVAGYKSPKVAAVYAVGVEEFESAKVAPTTTSYYGAQPSSNTVRRFSNSGFVVKNLFSKARENVTIEYWIKPSTCTNWNQQMGPGWADNFMIHTTSASELVVGWNTGARITSATNALKSNKWNHVAVVVNGKQITAYVNGENVGEVTSGNNGLSAFGDFAVGVAGGNGINGMLDEFRVWNTARSQREIQSMMYSEVASPTGLSDLLVEVRMDETPDGGLIDETGNYTIEKLAGTQTSSTDNTLLVDNRELTADFSISAAPYYAGNVVDIKNLASSNAVRCEWVIDGKNYSVENPSVVFDTAGEKSIKLIAYDSKGNSVECEKSITVVNLIAPVAAFTTQTRVNVGQRISFVNTTKPAEGCTYKWSMPGADVEEVTTANAAASYSEPGKYTVTLTATNSAGTSTASKTFEVRMIAPEVDFEVKPAAILKGGKVSLVDATKHSPENWHWIVSDNSNHFVSLEKNCEFAFETPGLYSVTLQASNEAGSSSKTLERAIAVCNADAMTGLNFRGGADEVVTFKNPLTLATSHAFTIEWWFNPKRNVTSSHAIGGATSNLLISTAADGTLAFTMQNTTYNSSPGLVLVGEWHHYAVAFNYGDVYIYRDGKLIDLIWTRFMGKYPTLPENFTLGGSGGPMNGMIDELRIWNRQLSQEELLASANAPIEDVAAAEKNGLALYYQFNQNAGNVKDATSNGNDGVRTGFGPEGDAWSSSLGAFCLSQTARQDVTDSYMTNYKKPFLHSNKSINDYVKNHYMELLQGTETSKWVVENPVVVGNVSTSVHVDAKEDCAFALTLKNYNFEAQVTNHKVYQTITLPAGHYVFGFKDIQQATDIESFIVVAAGEGLPNTADIDDALAYDLLSVKEVEFTVEREMTVSVGLLINTRGETSMLIERFFIEKKNSNDDFSWVGIEAIESNEHRDVYVSSEQGAVVLNSIEEKNVSIYNVYGVLVRNVTVDGRVRVELPQGIYVVEGKKVLVK